jgi:hypothetical protein
MRRLFWYITYMIKGSLNRTGKTQRAYLKYLKTNPPSDKCPLCSFDDHPEQIVKKYKLFKVVTNIFGYDMWDNLGVVDHLMIVPNRHVIGVGEFDAAEREEHFSTVSEYEKQGYSMYQRAPTNVGKSIPHQHSHLLKLDDKPKNVVLYVRSPHLTLFK